MVLKQRRLSGGNLVVQHQLHHNETKDVRVLKISTPHQRTVHQRDPGGWGNLRFCNRKWVVGRSGNFIKTPTLR